MKALELESHQQFVFNFSWSNDAKKESKPKACSALYSVDVISAVMLMTEERKTNENAENEK
jgi:hypothetical protein